MISTSIKKLDQILGGGIKNGVIIDIFGANGTGKTQLAMQISINSLLNGGQILFQDTTGEFRPERMYEIIKIRKLDVSIMEKIHVARITNTSEQIQSISKISKYNYDLIVIDNISDLFSFEYSKDNLSLEKNISFMKYMYALSKLSIQNKVPVVLTNVVRNIDGVEIENLKKSITMFTHLTIKLTKKDQKFIGNVSSPFGKNKFYYKISSNGLCDLS